MDAVTPEHALLAEVPKLRVADRAARPAMIHRVPARLLGIGGFDDDVAAEIRDLAAIRAVAEMVECERRIERQLIGRDRRDDPLLGLRVVFRVRAEGLRDLVLPRRRGQQHAVAGAPAGDLFRERNRRVARVHGRAELHPGVIQLRAVKLHPPAAADDRRARLRVHPLEENEPNPRRERRRDRLVRSPDLQRRLGLQRRRIGKMRVAVEAVLARVVARLDFQQPHVQSRIAIARKAERARDKHRPHRLSRIAVVKHRIPGANLHARPRRRHLPRAPSGAVRPGAAARRADDRLSRVHRARAEQQEREDEKPEIHRGEASDGAGAGANGQGGWRRVRREVLQE